MISHTGMVILDVGMLSGFKLSPGAAAPTDLIRKVEILPEKVSLYLDSVSVCHQHADISCLVLQHKLQVKIEVLVMHNICFPR